VGVCAVVAVIAASSGAAADEKSEARVHYAKGTKAFDLGAYDEAVSEYSLAYRLHDEPALLYNIGQAHRLAGHTAEAIRLYRMYLLRSPNAANQGEVEEKISELQKLLDQQKKASNLPPDQPRPPDSTGQHVETSAAQPPPTREAPPSTADNQAAARGRTKKIAGLVTAGVGVAAVVVGATFGGLAQKNSDDLTKLAQNMQPFDSSKASAGKTDQILEGVFLGVGAAAVATGVVLYVLGHREAKEARVAVAPILNSQTVGAAVRMGF
jgi:tetratricopeptide (TPR) repeat protein